MGDITKMTTNSSSKITQGLRIEVMATTQSCKFFLKGYCKKGHNCTFLHEPEISSVPQCRFYHGPVSQIYTKEPYIR